VLVTEEFVKSFGWKDSAIGKRIVWMDTTQFYVIGVIRNVYSRALWNPIQPMMIRFCPPEKYQQLLVRTDPRKMASVNEFMEKKWKEVFPNAQYTGQMIDQELSETNDINNNVVTMFSFLGAFAALMTGIGLYALVSLNIVRKTKEIGVRKVLGASVANIVGVINREFLLNLGVATIIGGVLGWLGANFVMDGIWTYYLKVGITTMILAGAVMFAIGMLAVGYKTITTASLNPTKTLRDE
jgi:putative ABC transport system permease protein